MSDSNGSSGDSSGPEMPPLVPQKHGGALYAGGVPGHKGGGGRPPSELKLAMRGILEEGLPQLREFVIGERSQKIKKIVKVGCPECLHQVEAEVELEVVGPPKEADQLRAIEIVSRYGLDVKVDKTLVDELWAIVELHVPEEEQPKIKREWNRLIGQKLVEAVVT